MQIGELSNRSGASVRSLRYYEQQGYLHRSVPAMAIGRTPTMLSRRSKPSAHCSRSGCPPLC